MANFLFIDTETTGLPIDWKAPVEKAGNWPRLVQIAWIVCDSTRAINEEREHIIYPDGFVIPEGATKVHRISTQMAKDKGVSLDEALLALNGHIENADYVVAHNINFDEKIVGAEFHNRRMQTTLFSKRRICTMKSSVDFCELPGNYGYKWPKLSELHQKLFDTEQEEAHNALVDIQTTYKCFWKLEELGVIRLS